MILECARCGCSHALGSVEMPDPGTSLWRVPRGVFHCNVCGDNTYFLLPFDDSSSLHRTPLSRMAEAFKKFSDATIMMIDSKTTYDTGKGGNFADRMTSPVGWLHDASKYLHEVYQHCLGDTKLTKEEARRNLYKVAHCCQLAADRL